MNTDLKRPGHWHWIRANLTFIALLAPPVKWVVLPTLDIPYPVVVAIWTLSVVAGSFLVYWIKRSLDSARPWAFPGPDWLRRIVFNLPEPPSNTGAPESRPDFVVVESGTNGLFANRLRREHHDVAVQITGFLPDAIDLEARDRELRKKLDGASAILLIWNSSLRDSHDILRTVVEWANQHVDRPVLLVNCIPDEPYSLPFASIPESRRREAVSLLLARGVVRSQVWRTHTSMLRRVLAAVVVISLLLSGLAAVAAHHVTRRMFRDAVVTESRKELPAQIASYHRYDTNDPDYREHIREAVNRSMARLEERLSSICALGGQDKVKVTVWRSIEVDSAGTWVRLLVKVGSSDDGEVTIFPDGYGSVIGTIFEVQQGFVMWLRKTIPGGGAIWDDRGRESGHWNARGEIEFDTGPGGSKPVGRYDERAHDDPDRAGLFGRAMGDGFTASAILVDTHGDPRSLRDRAARELVNDALTGLQSLPDSAFLSKKVVEAIAAHLGLKPGPNGKLPRIRLRAPGEESPTPLLAARR